MSTIRLTQAEYLRHELLDRTDMVRDILDSTLGNHLSLTSKVAFTPEQKAKIREYLSGAEANLTSMYRLIGEIHL